MRSRCLSVIASSLLWLLCGISCKKESTTSCLANLRMIDGAKVMLASEHSLTNGTYISREDLLPYVRHWPSCPNNGEYTIGRIGESPKCSYPSHSKYVLPRD